jgi:isopentenyl diphosphate isomerase/L-lactate dehydrogenase-like FMN-dependent dehydrogenase
VARAAKTGDHLQILSSQATTSIKDTIAARGKPIWYQLYATNKFEVAKHHVESAEQQGAIVVAVTVDSSGGRNQETLFRLQKSDPRNCVECHDRSSLNAQYKRRPMYQGVDMTGLPSIAATAMTWDYVKRIRDLTKMKMVLKGILSWEDAKIAAEAGFDGIIVSNHGGRQLDGAPATFTLVAPVADAVGGRVEIICDGGVRRGSDIVKAVAAGADACMAGRAYLYALGAGGERGVDRVLSWFRDDLADTVAAADRRMHRFLDAADECATAAGLGHELGPPARPGTVAVSFTPARLDLRAEGIGTILFATCSVFGRMASTNEIVAIKAGRTRAHIAVGSPQGPAFDATGALVKDPKIEDKLMRAYAKKYPEGWPAHADSFRNGFRSGERVLVMYTPR